MLGSIASVFISIMTSLNIGGATTIVRTFKIMRVLRLIKRAKSLKVVFNTFIFTLPALVNIGSLLLLLLYLYSILGVYFFGVIKLNDSLKPNLNFQNFFNAFVTLFAVATGDNWGGVVISVAR